ncbi:MAG: hypothetical protein KJT03_01925 [Verrucomicrobiae bacterium]|nr:hypothetical protein [Verrucomicrobiae bacterium]
MMEQPCIAPHVPDHALIPLIGRVKNLDNYAHFDRCLPSDIYQCLAHLLHLIKSLNLARVVDREKVLRGIERLAYLCRRYEESIQPTKTMIAIRILDLELLEYQTNGST